MPLIPGKMNNRIILGLMTFGYSEADGARITDLGTFNNILDVFQSRGYHELDTARMYCDKKQEAFTREAGWKDRGFTLATKIDYPINPGDNSREKVIESVEKSLQELGTGRVDLLYVHRPDRGTPFSETFEAVNELHKAGKFVNLGISNFAAFEVAEVTMMCKQNGWVCPTIYQGMYNCITRNIEHELFAACRRYGLDIVVYNPIAGGLFSGKIKSKDILPESGRFSDVNVDIGNAYRNRYFKETTFQALQLIEQAAEKHNLTVIETALRWMVHHSGLKITDGNDGILIGISSVSQLEENLTHLEKGPLPDGVVQAVDQAWEVNRAESVPYWHGELEYTYNVREALFGKGVK